ncbi:MAG: MEDS domain-containing protein, partial [Anaerolineae bacterium]|nr:MEDS domain-containing protein [Anaerolineae bacterium]
MPTEQILRAITDLQSGDHLGFLYQTEVEYRALLIPYLRQGLDQGEQVFSISDIHSTETILNYLRDDGLAPEPYLARGQLRLLTPAETYLRTGAFNPSDMLAFWRTATEQAVAEGYQALRGAGELTWALQDRPNAKRLFEYESKLSAFLPSTNCLIICLYQGPRLDTEMLFNLLATHPTAAISPGIYGHFFYLPSVELMQGGLPAASLRYWLETLAERKQMEANLGKNRQRLQAIFDNALEAILLVDDQMRWVEANPAACDLLGYSRETLLQLTVLDVTQGEDGELTQQIWQAFINDGQHSGEYLLLRRDGTTVAVEYRAVANIVPGLHLVVVRDITERRRIEAESRHHTARLEAVAEISQALAKAGLDTQAVLNIIVRYTAEIIGDACVIN